MTNRILFAAAALAVSLPAQVTYDRILNAQREPGNWLTYSGGYRSWRYSPLDQINRDNVGHLHVAWIHQGATSLAACRRRRS